MNLPLGTALTHKLLGAVAFAVLASGAAVGAFASQDKLPGRTRHDALRTSITATATTTALATATQTATPNATPSQEGTPRAIKGIPTDNPQHHPADGDGICEKGETVVKTTPSGVQVNVPCKAVQDRGKGDKTPKANKTPEADEAPEADETRETDETPEADETPGAHDNNGRGDGHGKSASSGGGSTTN